MTSTFPTTYPHSINADNIIYLDNIYIYHTHYTLIRHYSYYLIHACYPNPFHINLLKYFFHSFFIFFQYQTPYYLFDIVGINRIINGGNQEENIIGQIRDGKITRPGQLRQGLLRPKPNNQRMRGD